MKVKIVSILLCAALLVIAGCSPKAADTGESSMTDEELTALFGEYSPTLDGAYAEGYAYRLYEAYGKSGQEQFIKALGQCEINDMRGIIALFVGETLNDTGRDGVEAMESLFERHKDGKNLSRKERYAVYEIYADTLFFSETLRIEE